MEPNQQILINNTQKEKILQNESTVVSLRQENDKLKKDILQLNSQIKLLSENSINFTNQVEENSKEIEKKISEKETEIDSLRIELKTLQEEYDILLNQNMNNKELLIQKDVELQENEKAHKQDLEEIAKINQEFQSITEKLNKEIDQYKAIINKPVKQDNENINPEDYQNLLIQNSYLVELIKTKEKLGEILNELTELTQKNIDLSNELEFFQGKKK